MRPSKSKVCEFYHIYGDLSIERKIDMEHMYKMALEVILKFCEKDDYSTTKNIMLICETVLKKETDKVGSEDKGDVCP